MKIAEKGSNIELIGDIKEFKTGIDPKNLELITTLLSSNLYSAPERSFIREIVSNAWDSHVEAGTTDIPVLVKIGRNYVTIRDFGTGISPERFENVYCNIGSSTKRDSNDYIGGFGIGKFASLAVSNTVHITSYYEGKAYHYLMLKDGNRITNNLVMTLDTEEKNGVEITVNDLYNMDKYYDALSYITFFPNVYVDGYNASLASTLNNTKIKYFKSFACASEAVCNKILLGNVLYPLDISMLFTEEKLFVTKLNHTGIVIRFNIGELQVTPNRESIIYSSETISLINKRILEVREEIYQHIKSHFKCDYTDITEWANSIDRQFSYDFFTDTYEPYRYGNFFTFSSDILCSDSILYKGKKLSARLASIILLILSSRNPNTKAVIDEKVYQNVDRLSYKVAPLGRFSSKKVLLIPPNQKLLAPIKEYLKEYYRGYAIVRKYSFKEFLDFVHNSTAYMDVDKEDMSEFTESMEDLYACIMQEAEVIDFTTDKDYLKFREELNSKKVKTTSVSNFYLYIWKNLDERYTNVRKTTKSFSTIYDAIKYIKEIHAGVVFDNIDSSNIDTANIICARGYVYITASIPVLMELADVKFTNVVSKYHVLNHDRVFVKLANIVKYFDKGFPEGFILSTVPSPIREEIRQVSKCYSKYVNSFELMRHVKSLNVPEDSYYKELAEKVRKYKSSFECLQFDYDLSLLNRQNKVFILAVIMKTKAYRLSAEAYNIIKDNKLLKVLCQKSLKQTM